jgi:uncharacterized protein YndB with AHSA1/START domain
VIARSYRASLEEVWSLWTTKEGFESWWGPGGFRTEVHTIEARPGGALHYDMTAVRQEEIEAMKRMGRAISTPVHARFTEIVPQRRLTLTNVIDFIVGVSPYESTIAVDLIPAGATVRMVVTLSRMHDEQFTQMSIAGFTSQLKKLEGRFGG